MQPMQGIVLGSREDLCQGAYNLLRLQNKHSKDAHVWVLSRGKGYILKELGQLHEEVHFDICLKVEEGLWFRHVNEKEDIKN